MLVIGNNLKVNINVRKGFIFYQKYVIISCMQQLESQRPKGGNIYGVWKIWFSIQGKRNLGHER